MFIWNIAETETDVGDSRNEKVGSPVNGYPECFEGGDPHPSPQQDWFFV